MARQFWLMAVIVFALLAQIERAVACDMMINPSVPASDHCYKHNTCDQQANQNTRSCCDFSSAHALKSGHCNDDHETITNQSLAGKLNPDFHMALIAVSLADVFSSSSITFIHLPDQASSLPGTQTYLTTQRLRI